MKKEPTTPAPLSEKKQQGETQQQARDKIASYIVERFSNGNVPLNLANLKHWFGSAAVYGIEWQSQHTGKQIEESRAVNADLRNDIHNLEVDNDILQQQIDQYKARIAELEAALRELWPLSTNAFGESTTDEIEADVTLNHLSEAIDKAKGLLHPTR